MRRGKRSNLDDRPRESVRENGDFSPPQLPAWKPVFAGDRCAPGYPGTFFGARRQAFQFPAIHMPDAIRLAIVSSTPHTAHRQSSRLHRLAVRCEEFGQAGDFVHCWFAWSIFVQHWFKQRSSHNNSRDIKFVAFLGGVGGDYYLTKINPRFAACLLWMFYRSVCWRDDRRLESDRRLRIKYYLEILWRVFFIAAGHTQYQYPYSSP